MCRQEVKLVNAFEILVNENFFIPVYLSSFCRISLVCTLREPLLDGTTDFLLIKMLVYHNMMCSVVLLVFWTIAKKPAVCRIAGHGNLHLVCVVRNLLNRYYPFNICCEAPNEILASHPFNVIARK